ncbi:hypothetical protein [Nocardia pseudovaccinii]|uniref:hypothetical protein n=1 Tax=Nocardia pseudovaccinii TaxID=189540 RepID=UPI0012F50270|nr:hypothetical protein [Nocardia pseudovaccinii]
MNELPLPGWHEALAAALHARIGPAGRRRTVASVQDIWVRLVRFVRFLDGLPDAPARPQDLVVAQVIAFEQARAASTKQRYVWADVREVGKLLSAAPLRKLVAQEVLDYVAKRTPLLLETKPGYSDRELRAITRAARTDVAKIRDRVLAGHALVARYHHAPQSLAAVEAEHAELLARIESTGVVPAIASPVHLAPRARLELAEQLFLTLADLAPLLVLLVAVTGYNVETIKELPAEHRLLEDRAVELRVIKRRRGVQRWSETVTWEIGPPGRELRTPGGLYLLLHRMTAAGRRFTGSQDLWSVWRMGSRAGVSGCEEHFSPFRRSLALSNLYTSRWAARHGLTADPADADTEDAPPALALPVEFNRLKTSIDVRRTKQMGGHLPSSAKTNTAPVLFRNYLRNDPTTIAWAQDVFGESLLDAEQSALAAHHRALERAGGALAVISGPADADHLEQAGLDATTARRSADRQLDTAWSACTDHDHHPATGKPCRQSFLDCFQCGNCLITRDHLPRLLGLLDAFTTRRQQLSEDQWWARYGKAWAAIRHDVVTKFSPAEIEQAAAAKTTDAMLDLVEKPWNQT